MKPGTRQFVLTLIAVLWAAPGILLAADEQKKDEEKKEPVEMTGRLAVPNKPDGRFYLVVPTGTERTKLPLVIGQLKGWPPERYAATDTKVVRVTGIMTVASFQVRPGVTEQSLTLIARTMVEVKEKPLPAPPFAQPLALPEGVIHVALPAGTFVLENMTRNGKPIIRLTANGMSIDAPRLFLGDGKIATEVEATKEGMHWPTSKGGKGWVLDGTDIWTAGSSLDRGSDYLKPEQLKPGAVYVTTPSIKFESKAGPGETTRSGGGP